MAWYGMVWYGMVKSVEDAFVNSLWDNTTGPGRFVHQQSSTRLRFYNTIPYTLGTETNDIMKPRFGFKR